MIFKRKIYDKLLNWKRESAGKKALLIEGARRIGKSTLCELFGKNEYRSYLVIDFGKRDAVVEDYFNRYLNDLDTLFMLLQAHYNVSLYTRESLIIFDEVQMFPQARAAIKYLVADGRFDYLETGSLISIRENVKDILIPSEERSIKMYPLDFEEFCLALGEGELFHYIEHCFNTLSPLDRGLHDKAMLVFKQYLLVGGMPKPLALFLENNRNFAPADEEKRDILKLYRNDIMKIDARYRSKVLAIYDQIPGLLSQHEKRIQFNKIQQGSHMNHYEETLFWLSDSMMTNECFLTSDPNIGLSINETRTYVKCYMADTGLLLSHAFDENELFSEDIYKQILAGELSLNEGMLYENAIAQMLVAKGHKLYFYTSYNSEKHRNDIEIDFLISSKSKLNFKLFPIEVKSGKKYTTKSLTRFIDKYRERIGRAYIIHPRNLSVKEDILCLPTYMTMFI